MSPFIIVTIVFVCSQRIKVCDVFNYVSNLLYDQTLVKSCTFC